MVSVGKVTRTTLKGLIKQKQHDIRVAREIAQEAKLQQTVKNAVRSVFPYGKYYLQVGEECGEKSRLKSSLVYENALDFVESDWAPWSKSYRTKCINYKA